VRARSNRSSRASRQVHAPRASFEELEIHTADGVALRAVVAQEAIEPTDDEVEAEIVRLAERLEEKVEKVRRDLERRGVLETVRSDLARGKALEFLVEHSTVVDEEGNVIDLTIPEEPQPIDTDDTNDTDDDPPDERSEA